MIFTEPEHYRFEITKAPAGYKVSFLDGELSIDGLEDVPIDVEGGVWDPQRIGTLAGILGMRTDEYDVLIELNNKPFGRINKHLWKVAFELAEKGIDDTKVAGMVPMEKFDAKE